MMKIYQYKCKLLSDIIITSDASTEGQQPSLDYIPGSKFLGIVAGKLYNTSDPIKTLDLFHNGNVQFGDANPIVGDTEFIKIPLSYYTKKGKGISDKIYIHHLIKSTSIQLKQMRNGYFSSPPNANFISIDQDSTLKSAQDSEKRRSKDGQMFGYQSLQVGSEWYFEIRDYKGEYSKEILGILEGKHRIGRSRSAEYGLIDIKFNKELEIINNSELSDLIYVYAKSNLCFIDEKTGNYLTQPRPEYLCSDPKAEIIWEKSQIKTRNYKGWNRKRWNKDTDRVIIERGSVFAVKLSKNINSEFFKKGIGVYKSEGFGQVIVNPDFLKSNEESLNFTLNKIEIKSERTYWIESAKHDDVVLKALNNIHLRSNFDSQIDEKVNKFLKSNGSIFKDISKSQWGILRNYGKHLSNKHQFEMMLFNKNSGFLYRGQSEKEWEHKNRRIILESEMKKLNDAEYLPFIIKLSNQMAKQN